MINGKSVSAVILAAGSSTRFGTGENKNYAILCQKPVLWYSLMVFYHSPMVDELLIAVKAGEEQKAKDLLSTLTPNKPVRLITGGATRPESVRNALNATQSDLVLIHDGARPLVEEHFIEECLSALEEYRVATVGIHTPDTVKITDGNDVVTETTRRSNTWLIQTPQAFYRTMLLECHRSKADADVTDDCMLLEDRGIPVKILPGAPSNLKITTEQDLQLAEFWLKQKQLCK